jgi:hypothetical protein
LKGSDKMQSEQPKKPEDLEKLLQRVEDTARAAAASRVYLRRFLAAFNRWRATKGLKPFRPPE